MAELVLIEASEYNELKSAISDMRDSLKLIGDKLLTPAKNRIEEEYITTEQAMELLHIESAKGFIAFRKRHKIYPADTGRPNKYLKSDFFGFKK